jgi:transposase-like protein
MARIKAKERGADEKAAIVMALLSGTRASELIRKHNISESALSKWRMRFIEGGRAALAVSRRTFSGADSALEAENHQLKEALADAVLQNEMLKKAYRA